MGYFEVVEERIEGLKKGTNLADQIVEFEAVREVAETEVQVEEGLEASSLNCPKGL